MSIKDTLAALRAMPGAGPNQSYRTPHCVAFGRKDVFLFSTDGVGLLAYRLNEDELALPEVTPIPVAEPTTATGIALRALIIGPAGWPVHSSIGALRLWTAGRDGPGRRPGVLNTVTVDMNRLFELLAFLPSGEVEVYSTVSLSIPFVRIQAGKTIAVMAGINGLLRHVKAGLPEFEIEVLPQQERVPHE